VGGHGILCPPSEKMGGTRPPCPPPNCAHVYVYDVALCGNTARNVALWGNTLRNLDMWFLISDWLATPAIYHASKNSQTQHSTGEKLWEASCEVKPSLSWKWPHIARIHRLPIEATATSDVVETVTSETETWLKFRDETETETLS